jgi:hypothetical protein
MTIPYRQRVVIIGAGFAGLWAARTLSHSQADCTSYPALPTALCPSCESKLFRVYNTQTAWKYLCKEEMILVDPENAQQALQVESE